MDFGGYGRDSKLWKRQYNVNILINIIMLRKNIKIISDAYLLG